MLEKNLIAAAPPFEKVLLQSRVLGIWIGIEPFTRTGQFFLNLNVFALVERESSLNDFKSAMFIKIAVIFVQLNERIDLSAKAKQSGVSMKRTVQF